MSDAVGFAAGSSSASAISSSGYWVSWSQLRLPIAVGYQLGWCRITFPATGYQVAWASLRVPYVVTLTLIPGGYGSQRAARSKRPLVDDRNDLQDLCEIWELMNRKAA